LNVWWVDIVVPVLLILMVYGFLLMVGVNVKWLTTRSNRTAENIYDQYADSPRKHGGSWKDDTSSTPSADSAGTKAP
jgi:hypothetical protein